MSFFTRKILGDRRSGKDRRKSDTGTKIRFERRSGIERRSGKDRRMSLYDRLPEEHRKTLEITIEEQRKTLEIYIKDSERHTG
jgi:hypothetical protein